MPIIDKNNLNGWNKPFTFEQLLTIFPDCIKDVRRNLRLTYKVVMPIIRQIANVRNNRSYDQMTKIFIEQRLRLKLENLEEYHQWRWLTKFNEYIKRRGSALNKLPIEEAKSVPILSLYDFQNVKKTYSRTMCSCPFHQDNSPSFCIYPTNTFYCFSCNKGGDCITFMRELHNISFVEAVKHIVNHG